MSKLNKNRVRERVKIKTKSRMKNKGRVVVFRSNKHMYAQYIDVNGKVVCGVSTLSKSLKGGFKYSGNKDAAKAVGVKMGELIKKLKLNSNIAFDRSGYIYHGRVAMVADGIRESKIDI